MKKIKLVLAVAILMTCLVVAPAMAANTITVNYASVEISDIDSDWLWTDSFTNVASGMKLISIRFNPGATDDRCVIKNGSAASTILFDSGKCVDETDARIQYYFDAIRRPVLDFSAGTYSADAKVSFEFDYKE